MTLGRFKLLMALAAALGAGLFALLSMEPEVITLMFTFPSQPFIDMLWQLAGISEGMRALAIALYVLVCLIPAAALLVISRRRRPYGEDWLLALLSAVLLVFMYRALVISYLGAVSVQMGALTVLAAWLALRLLRYFSGSDNAHLAKLAMWAVALLGLLCAFALGWQCAAAVSTAASPLIGSVLPDSASGAVISLLAESASVIAQNAIILYGCLLALRLADSFMPEGRLTDESVAEAEHLYRYSVRALTAVILIGMAANLIKLAFIRSAVSGSVNVSFKLTPLLFCLGALIVSRFLAAHKRLRDDNDLFV